MFVTSIIYIHFNSKLLQDCYGSQSDCVDEGGYRYCSDSDSDCLLSQQQAQSYQAGLVIALIASILGFILQVIHILVIVKWKQDTDIQQIQMVLQQQVDGQLHTISDVVPQKQSHYVNIQQPQVIYQHVSNQPENPQTLKDNQLQSDFGKKSFQQNEDEAKEVLVEKTSSKS